MRPFLQVPVISNALGGILVGLVTSHAGGVRKVIKEKEKKTHPYTIKAPAAKAEICVYIVFCLSRDL